MMSDEVILKRLDGHYTHLLQLALHSAEMQVVLTDIDALAKLDEGELISLVSDFKELNRTVGMLKQSARMIALSYDGVPPAEIQTLLDNIERIAP